MTRNEAMAHEEARLLAAEAVDADLEPAEAAWLDEHLAACPDCAAIAAEYEAIHAELASLAMPEPPRDLWARTQAALDQVDGAGGRARRSSVSMSRTSLFGSSLAVALVVLLAGASLLSQTPIARPAPATGSSAPIAVATTFNGATPLTGSTSQLAVVNGTSYWISGSNGVYEIMGGTPTCDPADTTCTVTTGGGKTLGTIASQTSVSAAIAPDANIAAVWTTDKIAILPLTDASKTVSLDQMTPQPTTAATPRPTPVPTATPAPSTASTTPTPAPSPVETAVASATATTSAQASAVATATATASAAMSETPKATSTPSATPIPTPAPTARPTTSGPLAILTGYEIVGRDPEFSSDGRTVAFSARPSDHSAGPDVFIWQNGDLRARRITTSHSDQFAGWFGGKLLVSEIASGRGSAASSDTVGATSYVFDVAKGTKLRISRPMLMPAVDPTGTYVVYWTGRVEFDPILGIWQPDGGDLYFDRWSNLTLVSTDAPASTSTPPSTSSPTLVATPTATATVTSAPTASSTIAAASPDAASSESPSAAATDVASATPAPTTAPTSAPTAAPPSLPQRLPVVSGSGAVRTWQIRWDASGRHIAAWVADKGSVKVGRLSLFSVNDDRDLVDTDEPLLNAERVMSTIQFDSSHLVWTSAVDGNTYLQAVPSIAPSSVSTSSTAPATAPLTTDRPGA